MKSSNFGVVSDFESYTVEQLADTWGISVKSVEKWLAQPPRLRPVQICLGCKVFHGSRVNLKIQRGHDRGTQTED